MIKPFEARYSPHKEFVETLHKIAVEEDALFVPSPDGGSAIFQIKSGPILQIRIEGKTEDLLMKEELHPAKLITVSVSACADEIALRTALGLMAHA